MGKTAAEARTSALQFDGKIPFYLDTGRFTFTTAAQLYLGMIVAPCDGEIVAAQYRSLASATGASAKINISKNATASGLMTYKSLQGQLASTVVNLMLASTWVASASKMVFKGDTISVGVKLGTAVGSGAVSLVFMPR